MIIFSIVATVLSVYTIMQRYYNYNIISSPGPFNSMTISQKFFFYMIWGYMIFTIGGARGLVSRIERSLARPTPRDQITVFDISRLSTVLRVQYR